MASLRQALCLALLVALAAPHVQAAKSAKITAIVLEVYCRTSAAGAWTRARVGMVLSSGAQVRTGKRSSCEIRFSDGSVVRLAPQTDMTISQMASKDMSVGYGKIYSNVVKGSGGATVRGGNGVASIKGTTWTSTVTGQGLTTCVVDGVVHVQLTAGGKTSDFEVGGLEELAPYMSGTQSLLDLPVGEFIDQVFLPWYNSFASGDDVRATPARLAELGILAQDLQEISQTLKLDVGPQLGGLVINVQSASAKGLHRAAPDFTGMNWVPPDAMLQVPPLTLAEGPPLETRVLGKRVMGPDVKVDLFGLWSDAPGGSVSGVRIRPRAVWNSLYFEGGVTGWTGFEDGWHTVLSEGFVSARPRCGTVTLGRQHFLDGPINNSNLGSLLNFDTADALRFQPRLGNWKFDLAYLDDTLPFQSADRSGWFGRAQTDLWHGSVAGNYVHEQGGNGASLDFSFPVVEGQWDVYGEFGDDVTGSHLETWGSYFPGLYQKRDVDLFVEYARHRGAPSLLSAYAYKDMPHHWTGMLKLQHTNEDHLSAGLGVIKRF